MSTYRIVFTGEILPGKTKESVMLDFAERFNILNQDHLRALFSGTPKTLKKGLDEDTAIRLLKALEGIGAAGRKEIEVPEVSSQLELTDNFFDSTPPISPIAHQLPVNYPTGLAEKLEQAQTQPVKSVSPKLAAKKRTPFPSSP